MSNKADKRGLVPKMRFPEFREAGEWQEKPLGTLGQTISGLSGKSGDDFGEGQPFVTYKQVFDCAWIDFSKCGRVRIADDENQNTLQRGDVLFTTSSETPDEVGYASVLLGSPSEPVYLNSFCFAFRPNCLHELIPEFSRYLFHSSAYRKLVTVLAQGITRFNISKGAFLKLSLPVPKEEEQQKLADCLASLDERITLEAQKLDTLKTHKKGLMQQLFPTEGETLPKLRFPEFCDGPDWEETALGDIAEIKLGKMLDSKKHTTGRLLPYLNNVSLRWNEVDTSNLPQMCFDDDELDRFGLKAGDVVVCEGGEPGRSAVWDGRLPYLKFQKAIHRVRFNVPFDPRLLVLYLEAVAGTNRFELLFTGGGIKHLTLETLATLKVPLISLAEQRQIADCLASLDNLITAQTKKLAALKVHKKGLMQQLFPALESDSEVSHG